MTGSAATVSPRRLVVTLSRIAAAVLGGYLFVWGLVALSIAGLASLGLDYDQAWMLAMLLAFLVYLVVFIWSFAARRLVLVWLVLLGGGTAMTVGAQLLVSG
ncbi:MAG TPA: hypothetical protein VFU13_00530 [Steroidobacteraceae bacterium]|nr:hypothetical protein [Steroidobacteraceae bacterium]